MEWWAIVLHDTQDTVKTHTHSHLMRQIRTTFPSSTQMGMVAKLYTRGNFVNTFGARWVTRGFQTFFSSTHSKKYILYSNSVNIYISSNNWNKNFTKQHLSLLIVIMLWYFLFSPILFQLKPSLHPQNAPQNPCCHNFRNNVLEEQSISLHPQPLPPKVLDWGVVGPCLSPLLNILGFAVWHFPLRCIPI